MSFFAAVDGVEDIVDDIVFRPYQGHLGDLLGKPSRGGGLLQAITRCAQVLNSYLDVREGFTDVAVGLGIKRPTNDHPIGAGSQSDMLNSFWRVPEIGFLPFYGAFLANGPHPFILAWKKLHWRHRAVFIVIRFYVFIASCDSSSNRRIAKVLEKGLLLPVVDCLRVYLEKCMLEEELKTTRLGRLQSLQSSYLVCTTARLMAIAGVVEKYVGLFYEEEDIPNPSYEQMIVPSPQPFFSAHVWLWR